MVVRWFGGIKLGAGGLVRAYTEAVTTALDAAPLVRRVRSRLFTLDLGYPPELGTLEAQLRNALTVADVAYGPESARLTLSVPDADDAIAEAVRTVAALTAGGVRTHRGGHHLAGHLSAVPAHRACDQPAAPGSSDPSRRYGVQPIAASAITA